ncbi:hypothetical protein Mgra_00009023 [Meloidogyne graminicola]|uniref:Uncharacterized protein n=1 Tax=Meloidogyne graminicola TaxID=189291 RepID=A0A8S9ZE47_9BILA|nr:hypothetical protein Mgra_00009023 [Meloidogyne graminicola]
MLRNLQLRMDLLFTSSTVSCCLYGYSAVPLQHLIFPCGADGLYEVVDIKGNFKQDNFQKAMNFLVDSQPLGDNVA